MTYQTVVKGQQKFSHQSVNEFIGLLRSVITLIQLPECDPFWAIAGCERNVYRNFGLKLHFVFLRFVWCWWLNYRYRLPV